MVDQKSVEERNNFDEKKKCYFLNKIRQNCKSTYMFYGNCKKETTHIF